MDVLDLYADTPSHRYDTEGAITYQTCCGILQTREEGIRMKGKHYDYVIEDDLINRCGCITDTKDFKDVMDWYRHTQGVDFSNPLQPKIKWEGDDKMTKYLFHIILFNTETEQIDFKGYIAASSDDDARMLAAQTFGKFDPKVHATNCKQIMSYGK